LRRGVAQAPPLFFLSENTLSSYIKGGIMKELIESIKSISFHLRWIFMSSRERYPYLWARTKKLDYLPNVVQI
jgi:hypothetical protein